MLSDPRERSAVVSQIGERLSKIRGLVHPAEDLHAQVEAVTGTELSRVPVRARDLWRDIIDRVRIVQAADIKRASVSKLTELDRALVAFVDICECSESSRMGRDVDEPLKGRVLGYMSSLGNDFDKLVDALHDALESVRNNTADQETTESRLKKVEQATEKLRADHNARDGHHGQYLQGLRDELDRAINKFEATGAVTIERINKQATDDVNKHVASVVIAEQSAKNLIEQLTKLEQLQGVARFSDSFADRGNKVSRWAWLWLVGGIAALIVAVFAAFVFSGPYPFLQQWTPAAFENIGRLVVVVFAPLGFSAYCLRTFHTRRNLREDYMYRQLALETFNTFNVSAHDPATKDRVLLYACRTIFSTQTSTVPAKAAESVPFDAEALAKILAQRQS